MDENIGSVIYRNKWIQTRIKKPQSNLKYSFIFNYLENNCSLKN